MKTNQLLNTEVTNSWYQIIEYGLQTACITLILSISYTGSLTFFESFKVLLQNIFQKQKNFSEESFQQFGTWYIIVLREFMRLSIIFSPLKGQKFIYLEIILRRSLISCAMSACDLARKMFFKSSALMGRSIL